MSRKRVADVTKWPKVALGEVAAIERDGVQPGRILSGTMYVGLEDIQNGGALLNPKPVEAGQLGSAKFRFDRRHVLYGKLRPNLAKIACPDFAGICSTDIVPIAPGDRLDRRYLLYFLRQPSMVAYAASRTSGINLPRISPSVLESFELPLPSLREQRRIADFLDRADAVRAQRRAALALLDSLPQAIFLDVFGSEREQQSRWQTVPVSAYVAAFQGGKSLEAEADDDVKTVNRVLKVSAVTGMTYRPHESKPVPDDYTPPADHYVKPGDLLFSRANTTQLVGAVAHVESTPSNLLLPDKLWRFVWHQPAVTEPLFVWHLFQSDAIRREISRRATGL
jgi:type I restriction enzyme S subunit